MRRGDFSAGRRQHQRSADRPSVSAATSSRPTRLDPLAVAMVNQYQPLPNQTGANNLRGVTGSEDTQNQFITRVDHVLAQRQKIFGHYLYQGRDNPSTPDQHGLPGAARLQQPQRGGSARDDLELHRPQRDALRLHARRPQPPEPAARRPGSRSRTTSGSAGCWSAGRTAARRTKTRSDSRRSTSRASTGSATASGGEGIDKSQTYQFVNNLTLIRGRHALKMGADIRRLMGDATSTNAPFGALDFTRDITGHAAAAFMLGFPRTARTPGGHSDRRHPPMAHGLLRSGRLADDAARDREPRSPLRPQPAAEGRQRREPHAALRSRSARPGAVARAGRSRRRAVLQQASPLGAAPRLRVPVERHARRPRRIRRLQHGAAPRQHQHARHEPADRERAGDQPDAESARHDREPVPGGAGAGQHDFQRDVGGGRSQSPGRLLPELERGGRIRAVAIAPPSRCATSARRAATWIRA